MSSIGVCQTVNEVALISKSAVISSAQGVFANHAIWVIIHRVTSGPVSLMGYFIVDLGCSLNESSLLHSRAKELSFTVFSPYVSDLSCPK